MTPKKEIMPNTKAVQYMIISTIARNLKTDSKKLYKLFIKTYKKKFKVNKPLFKQAYKLQKKGYKMG